MDRVGGKRAMDRQALIVTCAVTSLHFCSRLRAPNIERIQGVESRHLLLRARDTFRVYNAYYLPSVGYYIH